jgi:thiol-disulfide isomerase/thioredoxin
MEILSRPTSGHIYFGDRLLSGVPEHFLTDIRRHTFGFIFQLETANRLLVEFELTDKSDSRVEWLSGGEAQRVVSEVSAISASTMVLAAAATVVFTQDPQSQGIWFISLGYSCLCAVLLIIFYLIAAWSVFNSNLVMQSLVVTAYRLPTIWFLCLVCCLTMGCDRVQRPVQIAESMPDFLLPNAQDEQIAVPSTLRGRVVLNHFWTDWCSSCLKELEVSKGLMQRYRSADKLPDRPSGTATATLHRRDAS